MARTVSLSVSKRYHLLRYIRTDFEGKSETKRGHQGGLHLAALEISQTPAREALMQLSSEGYDGNEGLS
jgi:hypothetical protein